MDMNLWGSGQQLFNRWFSPSDIVKYHGLLNQRATSYLNSVLQVLFMTENFREAVDRFACENPGTEYIDHHLKELFDDLKEQTASTIKITEKLGIDRVYEQSNAAEYLEKILTLTSPQVSQIFHGQLTHMNICSQCRVEKNTEGKFWHLPLELVDSYSEHYSVVDGTKEFFRDVHFSGENQMYCDECDDKADAETKCVIKHHPEVLTLLLKRFEFDYRYMMFVKNSRAVDVPCTLQIPENQTYDLYAVVKHFGNLRSGQYTATIKSQDDERWYNFNDAIVTSVDFQQSQVDQLKSSRSAYLLFYRKRKSPAANTCAEDMMEVSDNGGFPPADDCEQCQDISGREEDEERAEVGYDLTEVVCIGRNEETRIAVSVGSRGVEQEQEEETTKVHEADNQAETEHKERAEDQDYGGAGIDVKVGVSDRPARHNHLNKQDEMSDVQRSVKTDRDKPTADDEQSGKKEKSSAEFVKEGEGLVRVKDKKGEIVADKLMSGGGKLLTKYDLYRHEFHDNGRVSEQNMADDDQGCRRGCSHMCKIHEQQREERKEDKEQETKDDKQAQRRRTPTTKGSQDQDKRGLDDVRSKRQEQKISVNEDVSVEEQAKEQENKGHTQHNQNRESQRQAAWAERESAEKTRQKNSQSKERSGFKEVREKGRGGSVQSRVVYVKTVEEEVEKTPSGNLIRTQTKTMRIETSPENIKSHVRPFKRNAEAKTNPKSDGQDTLSKGVSNLQLTESKKHGTKRSIESVEQGSGTNTATDLNATKSRTESDTQDTSKKKGAYSRKRKWCRRFFKQKQLKTRKEKKSKTPQSLSCFLMKTNAESDYVHFP